MLQELRVENLLLIERAELDLAPGLNVLTGETGAGKTVLAHALDLLLGGRARSGIVRPGAAEAYVEGSFALPDALRHERGELLAADAEEIVLARRVGTDGRTRAYVNGRSAAVADLRRLGTCLLEFYGQHEHRKLTLAAAQLEILDRFCGPEQAARRSACAAAHRELRAVSAELEDLRELAGARERELDLLEYEFAEIEQAALQEGEAERLAGDRERLRRLDSLRAAAGLSAQALAPAMPDAPGAGALLADAAGRLDALAGVDAELDALAERCRALQIEAEDVAGELARYGEALAAQDGTLESVEERLALLERLMRKYGGALVDVLAYAERARERRAQLLGAEVALEHASARRVSAQVALDTQVEGLRAARARAAPRLARAVAEQLASLAMPEATFEVRLTPCEVGPSGGEGVEFLIASNPGVAPGPLREIASGGELSRIMLALSAVADGGASAAARKAPKRGARARVGCEESRAGNDGAKLARAGSKLGGAGSAGSERATLVFDEVDAGIGGHTARAVGERLRELAGARQLLCITHLPQIASLADRHFSVVKDTSAKPTRTEVVRLGEPDVVAELVRMLGAPEDDVTARRHARELRKAA
ncbi:MAG TPA: DNA repair protein RecN [Solirubrobacteraceae bacterium]|nr:DNA repair protein RecN [Solirubrobacteraceae bacterium]